MDSNKIILTINFSFAARGFYPAMWKYFKEAIELAIEYRVVLGKDNFGDLNAQQKTKVQVCNLFLSLD